MAAHAFIGTWEISFIRSKGELSTSDELNENFGSEGARFRLDENGEVTWIVPEEFKTIPLFSCETYEMYNRPSLGLYLRFGAYAGHVIQFQVKWDQHKEELELACSEWGILHCIRAIDDHEETPHTAPFSLLPALEDGYFSDLKISAANHKQFKIHLCVVQLQADDIPWHSQPPPFTGLVEEVLGTILHYLYAECLPNTLTEAAARQVIAAAAPYPSLAKLVNMCQVYLKNMALKQQIIVLVNDMHGWINQIIERFSTRHNFSSEDNITANPAKLCFVVKQSLRDAAVAGAKLLLLCDLFNKRKNELSRDERHEIIRYAMSRLPIFLSQLRRFLVALKSTFSAMSSSQRQEVATYLVPEIEIILETISDLVNEIERALLQIIQALSPSENIRTKSGIADMLSRSLRSILHIRDLTKLRSFHEHITCSLGLLLHKRDNFNELSPSQKVRSVARNLEQLIEEMPPFLLRVEEFTAALDEKLDWKDFKFCFKVGTSKVAGVLHKLVAHKEKLQRVVVQMCNLVQRDPFTHSMHSLGLLHSGSNPSRSADAQKMSKSSSFGTPKQHQPGYKLNLVESLCVPPNATASTLSKKSLELLRSGKDSDMVFEIVNAPDPTGSEQTDEAACSPPAETGIIRAHRVIVAARCDWLRRALLSGMREAIDKKIVIYDTSTFLFRIFLEYLYSGCLRKQSLNTDQLAELLLLSDRYEVDSLKQACEHALKHSIDQDSVLYFLSMADQFNADILKDACLTYISHHQEVTENDVFFELPITLQSEILDCVCWSQRPAQKSTAMEHLLPTPVYELQENFSALHLNAELDHLSSGSLDDLSLSHDIARLNMCVAQLRDVLGDRAPREKLVQVILAADYNPGRAINFYLRNEKEE